MLKVLLDGQEIATVEEYVDRVSMQTRNGESGAVRFNGSGYIHLVTERRSSNVPNLSEEEGRADLIENRAKSHAELTTERFDTLPVVLPSESGKTSFKTAEEKQEEVAKRNEAAAKKATPAKSETTPVSSKVSPQ